MVLIALERDLSISITADRFELLGYFVQSVSKNVKKQCFLALFEEHRAKRSKNAVFSHFLQTLYKV